MEAEERGTAIDPFVRVVVLNWNSAWFTRRCLRSLEETDYPADRFEVVLVDNGSIDGSLERLRDWFPELRIVENGENLGFAEGCNRAMRARGGVDAIALINNDAVADAGWLRAMVDALGVDDRIGAVSARLVLEPGFVRVDVRVAGTVDVDKVRIDGVDVTGAVRYSGFEAVSNAAWPLDITHRLHGGSATMWVPAGASVGEVELRFAGDGLVTLLHDGEESTISAPGVSVLAAGSERTRLLNGIGTARNERAEGYDRHYGVPEGTLAEERESVVDVDGVCGGAALLRSTMLDEVGLFDPRLFAYYEDTDLSWRATRAGWRMVAAPAARVEHAFGASGGSRAVGFFHLDRRNWWLTAERNATEPQRSLVRSEVRREVRTAVRSNIAGRLKRRHLPSVVLVRAWVAIVADHASEARRRNHPAFGPVGSRPTAKVVGRFQPKSRPGIPGPRPWGPVHLQIAVDDLIAASTPLGWRPEDVVSATTVVRALLQDHPELDVVATVVRPDGARRVASPRQMATLLGAPLAVPATTVAIAAPDPEVTVRLVPVADGVEALVVASHGQLGAVRLDDDAAEAVANLSLEVRRNPTMRGRDAG
ncbi:MAG TPA: glycosyltransferase family 2 protein [Microthrixaceae bacterium]|nr:glycosyltransferase family 2 protein [Microthrixaceae bacterium]